MERDLVEEVGRIHRYGSVPEAPLVGAVMPPPFDRRRAMVRAIEDRLSGSARCSQLLSYSFQSDDLLARVNADGGDFVTAQNPVAPELSRIRRVVLPSVLGALEGEDAANDIPSGSAEPGARPPTASAEGGALGEVPVASGIGESCALAAEKSRVPAMPGGLAKGGALGAAPGTGGGPRTGDGTRSPGSHAGASDAPTATAMVWALVAASIASDSSGPATSPPAHEAAGIEPLPLPITT